MRQEPVVLAHTALFTYHCTVMTHTREVGTSVDFMGVAWMDSGQYRRVVPVGKFPLAVAEVVGVGGDARLQRLCQQLRAQGVKPVQVHGPTGYSGKEPQCDRAKLRLIGTFMPDPKTLEAQLPDLDIVMHAPAIRRFLSDGARGQFPYRTHPRWLVENHDPGLGGVVEALSLAGRLQERGIPSGVIVDLVHVIHRLVGNAFNTMWSALAEFLSRMSQTPGGIIGVHIPVGTLRDDSLPELTHAQRTQLVASLGSAVERVIFEYQRGGPFGLVHLFPSQENGVRDRMTRIFNQWADAGLFTEVGGTQRVG